MTCRVVTVGGNAAIVCGPRPVVRKCGCGNVCIYLCDWKVGDGKTCDARLCERCRTPVEIHTSHGESQTVKKADLCRTHNEAYTTWLVTHPQQEPRPA